MLLGRRESGRRRTRTQDRHHERVTCISGNLAGFENEKEKECRTAGKKQRRDEWNPRIRASACPHAGLLDEWRPLLATWCVQMAIRLVSTAHTLLSPLSWSHPCAGGGSFSIPDQHAFSKHTLRKYFNHSNWKSFKRQLNNYGFRLSDQPSMTWKHSQK